MRIPFLSATLSFPDLNEADEDGLLACGGDLSPQRLLLAYQSGIFPWFHHDSQIFWWSSDPRMVLFPQMVKISGSMKRVLNSKRFHLSMDTCFDQVMELCAQVPRKGQQGTWISPGMRVAYRRLDEMGFIRSYEVWEGEDLVGGLYGLLMGPVFCAESMFSLRPNASKYALIKASESVRDQGCLLIDCQVYSAHLERMGGQLIPRQEYMEYLQAHNQGTQKK